MSTTAYEFTDHLLGGKLAERLTTYRKAKVGYRSIARLLANETGGDGVSGETIRRWCQELESVSS